MLRWLQTIAFPNMATGGGASGLEIGHRGEAVLQPSCNPSNFNCLLMETVGSFGAENILGQVIQACDVTRDETFSPTVQRQDRRGSG